MVQVGSQKYRKMFKHSIFLFLDYNQIWLNLHVDHHHFGYITKLTKKNTHVKSKLLGKQYEVLLRLKLLLDHNAPLQHSFQGVVLLAQLPR